MNVTVMDNMGIKYRCVFAGDNDIYVSEEGYVITGNPTRFHIPTKAANGELLVAHGIPGVPMEVGKLMLATIENNTLDKITGYKYINENLGMQPNNLRIVPAEESEVDIERDFLRNPAALRKIFVHNGMATGSGNDIDSVADAMGVKAEDIIEGLIKGGGYTSVNGIDFSVNRFFRSQRSYLTREAIVRLGQVGCYNMDTDKQEFMANNLSEIWYMCTNLRKSNLEVYKMLSERGSEMSDNFLIKFAIEGKVLEVDPIRQVAPLF